MNRLFPVALSCLSALGALSAHADSLYPNKRTPIANTVITATTTGDLFGYYLGGDAGGDDTIRMIDLTTGTVNAFTMENQTSAIDQAYDFGKVTAGDQLAFEIHDGDLFDPTNPYLLQHNTPNPVESSLGAVSTDGISHAYASSYDGTVNGLSGLTYLGFEDLPLAVSDLDYNDYQVAFGGVRATSVTPEPGTLLLLATGLVGVAGAVRRRLTATP